MAINFASLLAAGRWTRQQAESLVALSQAINADANPAAVTQEEAEAGSEAAIRSWSPERVSQAIAALASGGITWTVATTGQALVSGAPVLANIATAQDFTIPATIASADSFTLSNAPSSTSTARIVMGSGRILHGPLATTAAGDDVTIPAGATLSLVARGPNDLEVV